MLKSHKARYCNQLNTQPKTPATNTIIQSSHMDIPKLLNPHQTFPSIMSLYLFNIFTDDRN